VEWKNLLDRSNVGGWATIVFSRLLLLAV
jgi:hypothetical protein